MIAALIIIVIISVLLVKINSLRTNPPPHSFDELSDNFEQEVIKIIDQGVQEGLYYTAIESKIDDFATEYSDYVTSKEPEMGFLYVYNYEEINKDTGKKEKKIKVANFLIQNGKATFKDDKKEIPGGNEKTLHRITVEVGKEKFVRDLEIKASAFKGINMASGKGDYVIVDVAGIPYTIATTGEVGIKTLVFLCSPSEIGENLEECRIEFGNE